MSNKNEQRLQQYLSNFKNRGPQKQEEVRRRREEVAVELRKQKREESLAKRRNMAQVSGSVSESEDESLAPGTAAQVGLTYFVALDNFRRWLVLRSWLIL